MHSSKLKYSCLVAGIIFGLSPVTLFAFDTIDSMPDKSNEMNDVKNTMHNKVEEVKKDIKKDVKEVKKDVKKEEKKNKMKEMKEKKAKMMKQKHHKVEEHKELIKDKGPEAY